jgi:hypothetical protein
MFKIFKIIIISTFMMFAFAAGASAVERSTLNDLVENGKVMDGKTVKVRGEAIGEPMKRGEFTWINISDGTLPIGIWMKNEDAEKVKVFGDYSHKGDIIEVVGKFNRACREHGGDMDIHAEIVNVVEEGTTVNHVIDKTKVISSIALTALTLTLLGIYLYRRKQEV